MIDYLTRWGFRNIRIQLPDEVIRLPVRRGWRDHIITGYVWAILA